MYVVVARSAVDLILARSAVEDIVLWRTKDGVWAALALDDLCASGVASISCGDGVCAGSSEELVDPVTAVQRVVAALAA